MAAEIDDWEGEDDWEPAPAAATPTPTPLPAPDESSFGDAFVNNFGNTFGTAGTIGAGIQADLKGITNIPALVRGEMTPMENLRSIYDEFQKARAENKYIAKRDMETQKGASIGGRLLGGIMTAPISGVGNGVKAAATLGAAQGAVEGASESEAPDAVGVLEDAAKSAAIGGGLSWLGQGAGNYIASRLPGAAKAARDATNNFAEERAVKAVGPMLKDMREFGREGGMEGIRDLGRELLDRGVVTGGASTETIAKRALEEVGDAGDAMGTALKELDALTGARFNPSKAALRIERDVIAPLRDKPIYRNVVKQLEEEAAALTAQGDKDMTFEAANALKSSYDDFLNHTKEQSPFKEQLKRVRGILRDEIDTAAETVANSAGSDVADRFMEAKRLYRRFIPVADAAEDYTQRALKNRFTSPSDYGTGTGAMLLTSMATGGDPITSMAVGAGASLLHKVARERGSSVLAAGADRLASSDWLERLVQKSPDALGEYGGVLASALARGPAALAARDYVLSAKDPNYRQMKEAAQKAATGKQ